MEFYHLLSWPHQLRVLKRQPFPPDTCFRRAIFCHWSAHSLFTYRGYQSLDTCPSPLVQAFAHWVRQKNRPPQTLRANPKGPSADVRPLDKAEPKPCLMRQSPNLNLLALIVSFEVSWQYILTGFVPAAKISPFLTRQPTFSGLGSPRYMLKRLFPSGKAPCLVPLVLWKWEKVLWLPMRAYASVSDKMKL